MNKNMRNFMPISKPKSANHLIQLYMTHSVSLQHYIKVDAHRLLPWTQGSCILRLYSVSTLAM